MERLTERSKIGTAFFDDDGALIRGAGGAFHQKKDMTANFIHQRFVALDKAIDRLAAYEDTGLEPEEVAEYQHLCDSYVEAGLDAKFVQFCIDATQNGLSMNHIRELAQAEKDGRLVVLPCKEGDPIWWIDVAWLPQNGSMYFKISSGTFRYAMLDWQNPIYTSQAEAGAALKKREEADNETEAD